jgi:hypothetical protein
LFILSARFYSGFGRFLFITLNKLIIMKNSYKTVIRNLSGLLFFVLISVNLFAQTNFAGTWALNESKSNFGDSQFRMASTSMVVTQDAKILTVESTRPGRDGNEMKTTAKYNLDGTVSENPAYNTTRKSVVTWSADKTSLTIASTMTMERDGQTMEMKSSETWKLTEGGKMLMVDNVRNNREGNEVKTTAAYDKK